MKAREYVLAIAAAMTFTTCLAAQAATNTPAALLPADTLAYAEMNKPGELAQAIGELVKGSYFSHVPQSLSRLNAKYKDLPRWRLQQMKAVGLFCGPEVIRELQRVDGAAVALLSLTPNKDAREKVKAEWVAMVFPGKSHVPAFLTRAMVVGADMKMKSVATVDGVDIHQIYYRTYQYRKFDPDHGGSGVTERIAAGPALAMTPEMILIGTTNAVTQVVRRASGSVKTKSLAAVDTFQHTRKEIGSEPGLFAYGDPQKAFQSTLNLSDPITKAIMNRAKELVNPKAFRCLSASLSLKAGTLSYHLQAQLDPSEKSPLLETLPSKPVDQSLLAYVPKKSGIVVAISNKDGAKRWKLLKKTLDEIIPGGPNGRFSDIIQVLEQRVGVDFGKDVAAKIQGIAVSVGNPLLAKRVRTIEQRPGFRRESITPAIPIAVVVDTTDAASAKKLLDTVPKAMGIPGGFAKTENVQGFTVHSLPFQGQTLYFANHGKTLVVGGPTLDAVVNALNAGATSKVIMRNKALAKRLQMHHKRGVALVLVKPIGTVVSWANPSYSSSKMMKGNAPQQVPVVKKTEELPGGQFQQKLAKLLGDEPWLAMSLALDKQTVRFDGRMPDLQKVMPRFIDLAVEQTFQNAQEQYGRQRRFEDREKRIDRP